MSMNCAALLAALLLSRPAGQAPAPAPAPAHRLDPLSAAEIAVATDALGKAGRLPAPVRVVTIELAEPNKTPASIPRVARAVLYDWSSGATTEMTIDLARQAVSAPTV